MPLVYKARENLTIESRADLERSVANNLAIFFDALGGDLVYEIKQAFSVTFPDGTIQKAGSVRQEVGKNKDGSKKYKTFYNKFAVMDVFIKLDGFSKRKLARILLGGVNSASYNPTASELETESKNVRDLILTGKVKDVSEEIASPEQKLERGFYVILTTKEGKIQSEPFKTQTEAQAWEDKILKEYKRKGRTPSGTVSETDNPRLPIFKGIDDSGNTIFARQIETAPVVSGGGTGTERPGGTATTLLEWFQAFGQPLPTISERATLYESYGIGPREAYIASAEQNIALLTILKAK